MNLIYDSAKGDFGLELSLSPQMENSSNAFEAMAALIRALEEIDRDFAKTIDPVLDPRLVLQGLEIGSLRTWFASCIRDIPDEVLKDGDMKKVLGFFLVKVKYKLLKWLDGKETVNDVKEIEALRAEITQLKNEVESLRQLPVETPVPIVVVVMAVKKVSEAMKMLPSGQRIAFASSEGCLDINRSFSLTDDQIQQILTRTFRTERHLIALTIKKPDYLGTSMWDVITKDHAAKAKIIDKDWLERFHRREIPLLPGDALVGEVRIDTHLDENGKEIEKKYTIEQVKDVLRFDGEQMDLFNSPQFESIETQEDADEATQN